MGTTPSETAIPREDALERLRSARVGRLATVRPDGSPHVVPVVFVLVTEGEVVRAYWAIDHKPKRTRSLQRLANLEHDPRAELVVDGYEEDWSRLWWVRAGGRARTVLHDRERSTALDALRGKYPQDERLADDTVVVAIDLERVTGWSAAGGG